MEELLAWLFWIVILVAPVWYIVYLRKKRNTVVVDENSFSQNGVRVDFTAGTIIIKKHKYPVTAVTGIRWQSSGDKRVMTTQAGSVDIEVEDFKNPVHNILFNGLTAESDAKAFAQRLSMAIRKAGGDSFV